MSGFCSLCGYRVEDFRGLKGCPSCGATSVPCSDDDQVTVSVNWHELRVLCIWAERWAHHSAEQSALDSVYAIAMRLRRQHPDRGGLTLADEFGALRQAGYAVDVGSELPDERIKSEGAESAGGGE